MWVGEMDLEKLKYHKKHIWLFVQASQATLGLTEYGQQTLGDIVYIDLPPVGSRLEAGKRYGEVESVKTVYDLLSPVTGRVIEVNEVLLETPGLINKEPYGRGWLLKVELVNLKELNQLMDAEEYKKFITSIK
jgi:glycine cleavage system H protein